MDGDLAPLDRLIPLARQYGARVMVDDAHGIGVVGPTGRGTPEEFGLLDEVDLGRRDEQPEQSLDGEEQGSAAGTPAAPAPGSPAARCPPARAR